MQEQLNDEIEKFKERKKEEEKVRLILATIAFSKLKSYSNR